VATPRLLDSVDLPSWFLGTRLAWPAMSEGISGATYDSDGGQQLV